MSFNLYKALVHDRLLEIDSRVQNLVETRAVWVEDLKRVIRKEVADEIMTRPCGDEEPTVPMKPWEKGHRILEARRIHETQRP